MPSCLIGLGSNLGNRRQTLDRAVARLAAHPLVRITERSAWHETTSVGGPPGQSPFLNGAVVVETSLQPQALLEALQRIETDLGRRRSERWGPRTVDLDLLLYAELVLRTPSLVLPHPRMAWRRFVLQPAAEVAGSMVHPTTGWTVARLLDHLNTAAPYVAIAGSIAAGKTHLAERLAQQTSARLIAERLDAGQLETFYANPAVHAWQTELEFLHQRARLLAADSPEWSDEKRLALSDFWFDQSLAFARVWLPPEQLGAFHGHWEQARRGVVRPKLIVLLEVAAEELWRRVIRRGRSCERGLNQQRLDEISQAILAQATQPDQGPVLQLAAEDPDRVFDDVRAAVEAME